MKRPLIIILSFFFISFLFLTSVFAQSNNDNQRNIVLQSNEVIDKDYFASGDNVTVLGTVNGDAYVAGGNVLVDGNINGDLIVAGGSVTIRGMVREDVRVAGGQINISSANIDGNVTAGGGSIVLSDTAQVNGSLVAGGGQIDISSPIQRDAVLGGGNININSTINGDVQAGTNNLTLSPNARIQGDLTYWSDNQANISPTASVSGRIQQQAPPQQPVERKDVFANFFNFLRVIDFLTSFIVGTLLLLLFPIYTNRFANLVTQQSLKSLLVGFLAMIITPILILLLFITVLGIPIAIFLLFTFLVLIYLAKIIIAYAIGAKIFEYFKINLPNILALLIGLILYFLLTAIPIIGGLIALITLFVGLGAILIEEYNFYKTLRDKKMI